MTKVCVKCGTEFPYWKVINGKKRNLCSRKFCLECSPFGEHNTADLVKKDRMKTRKCIRCDKIKRIKGRGLCIACYQKEYYKERSKKHKKRLLETFGNKCSICGYDEYLDILVFHHTNPDKKEWCIARILATSFENILKEAKKCLLLCPNCHAKLHLKNGHVA